jgi:hypothetical protein
MKRDEVFTLDPGKVRLKGIVLAVFFLIQYTSILISVWEAIRVHDVSIAPWLKPIVNPMPLLVGLVYRRYTRQARAENLLSESAEKVCDELTIDLLLASYIYSAIFIAPH